MHNKFTLTLTTALVLAASSAAQNCSDNTYPLRLVNAAGALLPQSGGIYQPPNEMVYLAFDPAMPSGIYLVFVTDPIGGHDEVLSMNDLTDRFVHVTNNAGVITLSLPFSVNPDVPPFGAGLNGQGQSVPLFPFRSASWDPCHFKAWAGNGWTDPVDPLNPYVLPGGFDANAGVCRVRSYTRFDIGDGTGSDVTGLVFEDFDHDGVRDAGEPGLGGVQVQLVNTTTSTSTTTDGTGHFVFPNVLAGPYTVELPLVSGWNATTPSTVSIDVCGCSDVSVEFGRARQNQRHDGHTIGFWRNKHGLALITQYNLLPGINSLGLVDGTGNHVSFANLSQYATWLQNANATNMANMLSAQLVAMWCSVAVGNVGSGALISDPVLGIVPIGDVIAQAIASLAAHPYTPTGSPFRSAQEALKNALDDANNNHNWL